MARRIKVIADYPGNPESVGFIYQGDEWAESWYKEMEQYPHLFQPLQWWQDRKPEEMPEYVKFGDDRTSFLTIDSEIEPTVHKIKRQWATSLDTHWRYSDFQCFISDWRNQQYSYAQFVPATHEEYLSYQKQKQ
jgi:hypothetical protein